MVQKREGCTSVKLVDRHPWTGRRHAKERLDMAGEVGSHQIEGTLRRELANLSRQVGLIPQQPTRVLLHLEASIGGRCASQRDDRFGHVELGCRNGLGQLLRPELLLAFALHGAAPAVRMHHQDVEAALIVALSAQLADLGVGKPTLEQFGHESLKVVGRQAVEREDGHEWSDRQRDVLSLWPLRLGGGVHGGRDVVDRQVERRRQLGDHRPARSRLAFLPAADRLLANCEVRRECTLA